ncbi:MAG: hypothetical protein AAFR55_02625 [Pseudomonadota bacterium]
MTDFPRAHPASPHASYAARPALVAAHDNDTHASLVSLAAQFLGLAVIWLGFAWPWLSGAVTIPWDGKAHFAPQVQFLAASMERGEWPWWTPHIFAGHPQIADPQAMIFSPPMLLLAAMDATPSVTAIDRAVLLAVLFAGAGVVAWGRLAGWHWAAALIAASIFMFGGSMAWRLQHFGQVISLAYVPFTLVLIALAVRRGAVLAGASAGVLGACVLLGRDQVGLLAIYGLAAFALCELYAARRSAHRVRSVLALGVGAIVGVALIAVPLLLTLLLAEQSNRPTIDLAGAHAGSLHPALLATLVTPDLFGSGGPMAEFWGPPSFAWEDTGLYTAQNMGVVYLSAAGLLALMYGVASGAVAERGCRFFSVAALTMLVYALGWFTPIFAAIYEVVPGVDKFRRPADATFLIGGALAFVVGHVVSAVLTAQNMTLTANAEARGTRAGRFAVLGAAIALCGVAGLAVWRGRLDQTFPEIAFAGLAIGVTIAAFLAWRWLAPIRPVAGGALLVAVVAGELTIGNGPNGATALPTRAIDMLNPAAPTATIRTVRDALANASEADPVRRDRFELFGLGYHWPNASLSHGLPNTLGTNPVRLDWYTRATGAGDTAANIDQRKLPPLMARYDSPFARMLGIKFVLMPGSDDAAGPPGTLSSITTSDGHRLHTLPDPLPRVMFATSARHMDFDTAIETGELPPVDVSRTVLLPNTASTSDPAVPIGDAPVADAQIAIDRYANTVVQVSVTTDRAGWLVLHDTWHPWWRVEVNGARAPLLRANIIFRAVKLTAGTHDVRFVFKPLEGAWDQLFASRNAISDQTRPRSTPAPARGDGA